MRGYSPWGGVGRRSAGLCSVIKARLNGSLSYIPLCNGGVLNCFTSTQSSTEIARNKILNYCYSLYSNHPIITEKMKYNLL